MNLTFENGSHTTYKGAKTNAACVNGWGHEYIRAEKEGATLVLDERELVEQFVDWLNGGECMATNI